jgi:hypothetical protein
LPDYEGFALHSFRTVLVRPESGTLTVCAPLPDGFLEVCNKRGIERERLLGAVKVLAE